MSFLRSRHFVLPAIALFFVLIPFAPASDENKRDHYSALAFAAQGGSRTVNVNIQVQSYTPEEEILRLANHLKSEGPERFFKTVEKMPEIGRFSVVGHTGVEMRIVRERKTAKGRRVVMITDRPITFFEARNDTRSRDYPFGIVVLELDAQGEGIGQVYMAAKFHITKDQQLEVEHYGQQPVKLLGVRLWR